MSLSLYELVGERENEEEEEEENWSGAKLSKFVN